MRGIEILLGQLQQQPELPEQLAQLGQQLEQPEQQVEQPEQQLEQFVHKWLEQFEQQQELRKQEE